jgi:hypothetical protein
MKVLLRDDRKKGPDGTHEQRKEEGAEENRLKRGRIPDISDSRPNGAEEAFGR